MSGSLFQVIYFSRSMIRGSDAFLEAEVRDVLARARRNNSALNLSGALLFTRGAFVQVLEGECADVERIFERIQRDPRHAGIVVLRYAPVEKRAFPNWSMAYAGEAEEGLGQLESIAADSGFDPSILDGDAVLMRLREVVRRKERAPAA